jgi:hypothetical protein
MEGAVMETKHLSRELEQFDAVDLSALLEPLVMPDWEAVDAQIERDLAALALVDPFGLPDP